MSEKFDNELQEISYALGVNMGEYLTSLPLAIEGKLASQGFSDFCAGNNRMTPEEYRDAMQRFQAMLQQASRVQAERISSENREKGTAFLAENKQKDNVQETASGLQYEVLTAGEGAKPTAESTVKVHYTGKLLDGTVFDSSVQRGEPAQFGVTQVIPGWTEALQLMNVGSKYRLFIPADLAYGDRGAGQLIQPGSVLVFDVELLEVL